MRRIILFLVVSALLVLTLAATASANARDFCVDRNDGAAHFAKNNWNVPYGFPTQGQFVKEFAKFCHF